MNHRGFTLIELLVGILILGIASVTLLSFFSSGVTRSADPLAGLGDNIAVVRAVEKVNAHYRAQLSADPSQSMAIYNSSDLTSLISGISGTGVSGSYTAFSVPDSNRKVSEITASGTSIYVKVTATKNNSKLVTLLGN